MAKTLRDIAQQVGLSTQAVSQALNRTGRLRPETRQRILDVAAQLGYRPNAAARATVAGRHHAVTLLLGTESTRSTVTNGLLDGIQTAVQECRLNLMLVKLPDESLTDSHMLPRALEETASDGFLVDYTHGIPQRMVELIGRYNIPAVWVNSRQPSDCVHPDDFAAARQATEHLLALGHRRIAYADFCHGPEFPNPHYSVEDRRLGYVHAMRQAALEPRLLLPAGGRDVRCPDRLVWAREMLTSPDRPSAVLGYGPPELIPFLFVGASLGVSVPGDLSLVCFNDNTVKFYGPHLTVWLSPDRQVGLAATEMLLRKIAHPGEPQPSVLVPFTLYPGGTCAPPRV